MSDTSARGAKTPKSPPPNSETISSSPYSILGFSQTNGKCVNSQTIPPGGKTQSLTGTECRPIVPHQTVPASGRVICVSTGKSQPCGNVILNQSSQISDVTQISSVLGHRCENSSHIENTTGLNSSLKLNSIEQIKCNTENLAEGDVDMNGMKYVNNASTKVTINNQCDVRGQHGDVISSQCDVTGQHGDVRSSVRDVTGQHGDVMSSRMEKEDNTQVNKDSICTGDNITRNFEEDVLVGVDIDGLPLTGGRKRINLRRLLSQDSTEVYDDDCDITSCTAEAEASRSVEDQPALSESRPVDETCEEGFHIDDFEFPDDDEDEERLSRRLRRKSSLRTVASDCRDEGVRSPGGSGVTRKMVKFSDTLGMSLEDVRALLNPEEPPVIPSSALKDLNMRRRRAITERLYTLQIDFEIPSTRSDFILRLLEQKVVLENCMISAPEVCGVVRVANVAYEKRVFVRYTVNSWVTEHDILAVYVPDSSDGASDRFVFSIKLPEGFGVVESQQCSRSRLEYALCYCAGEVIYWDNNNGLNYVISCCPLQP